MKSGGDKGPTEPTPPKLAKRRANKNSPFRAGRTIGERREKLETASERSAAREKVKKKQKRRIISTILIYVALGVLTVVVGIKLFSHEERELPEPEIPTASVEPETYTPTVEIIDENTSLPEDHLTSRMKEYIGQAEADFRELGYIPTRVVIPSGTIREVDFYIDGYSGRIKLITDRGTGVSTEDADRMIRYLASIGVNDFEYIDVRIDGKAYWK